MKKFKEVFVLILTILYVLFFFFLSFTIWFNEFWPYDVWGIVLRLGLTWVIFAINLIVRNQRKLKTKIDFVNVDLEYRLGKLSKRSNKK